MPVQYNQPDSKVSIVGTLLLTVLLIIGAQAVFASTKVNLEPTTPEQLEAGHLLVQGSTLLKAKQPFKARELLEKAALLWPEEAHVHYNLGGCYQDMGQFERAINEYQKALELDPSITDCFADLGTCYQLLNQYSQSIQYFTLYLRHNPGATDAPQIKGMIAALIRQANKQVDSDPESLDYLASALKNGRLERWTHMPVRIFISNGTDERGRRANGFMSRYNEILVGALDTWVRASDYRLAYLLVDDASNADIVCTWTDQINFLKGGTSVEQGVTHTITRPAQNPQHEDILRCSVTILLVNPNTLQPITEDEVKKTCLHELGHAFGLSGHSTNNKDVMFYSEAPSVWAALTRRDKNTIARLYGDFPVFSWSAQAPVRTSQQYAYTQQQSAYMQQQSAYMQQQPQNAFMQQSPQNGSMQQPATNSYMQQMPRFQSMGSPNSYQQPGY